MSIFSKRQKIRSTFVMSHLNETTVQIFHLRVFQLSKLEFSWKLFKTCCIFHASCLKVIDFLAFAAVFVISRQNLFHFMVSGFSRNKEQRPSHRAHRLKNVCTIESRTVSVSVLVGHVINYVVKMIFFVFPGCILFSRRYRFICNKVVIIWGKVKKAI
jgi:hypothetical protein